GFLVKPVETKVWTRERALLPTASFPLSDLQSQAKSKVKGNVYGKTPRFSIQRRTLRAKREHDHPRDFVGGRFKPWLRGGSGIQADSILAGATELVAERMV